MNMNSENRSCPSTPFMLRKLFQSSVTTTKIRHFFPFQTSAFKHTHSHLFSHRISTLNLKMAKRKEIEQTQTEGQPATETKTKKSKKEKPPVSNSLSAPNGQIGDGVAPQEIPRNLTIPEELNFDKRPEGQIRISSWNITSVSKLCNV